jgi:putative ATP-binding cassette transporter
MPSTSRPRPIWSRFLTVASPFFRSEERWVAFGLLGLLAVFLLALGALNVFNTYVGRDFMTALAEREVGRFFSLVALFGGVFVVLTIVAVFKSFTEERLRLRWRHWLTRHLSDRYLSGRAYYRLKARADVDNPDQRLSEDVKTFTEQALALLLILANSTVTLVSFSGVLWSITPWLCLAAVAYAAFGSFVTVWVGRRLVKLDVQQYRKEADLRYDLIQVRVQAEPIALLAGEADENHRLRRRLGDVVANMKGIIGLTRNIGFFATGFDYMIQVIPLLIVAPLYMRGDVELGTVTQAQMVFMYVMGAFTLIVKEFQRLTTFGAVVERLGLFCEVLDEESDTSAKTPIEAVEDDTRVAFEGLTLTTPKDGRLLVKDLSVEVRRGESLLIRGPCGSGRTSLLRAAAGLWTAGQGRIARPPLAQVMFLPQHPYLRPGPLRDQILYGSRERKKADDEILALLRELHLEALLGRVGGLDAEHDWSSILSRGEQQQLAFARLLLIGPRFAFLDEPTSALDKPEANRLYGALSETPITYVSVAADPALADYHDQILELGLDGGWAVSPRRLAASA